MPNQTKANSFTSCAAIALQRHFSSIASWAATSSNNRRHSTGHRFVQAPYVRNVNVGPCLADVLEEFVLVRRVIVYRTSSDRPSVLDRALVGRIPAPRQNPAALVGEKLLSTLRCVRRCIVLLKNEAARSVCNPVPDFPNIVNNRRLVAIGL